MFLFLKPLTCSSKPQTKPSPRNASAMADANKAIYGQCKLLFLYFSQVTYTRAIPAVKDAKRSSAKINTLHNKIFNKIFDQLDPRTFVLFGIICKQLYDIHFAFHLRPIRIYHSSAYDTELVELLRGWIGDNYQTWYVTYEYPLLENFHFDSLI